MCNLLFASLQSSGYKNNLLKERGMAKDCNTGESCSGSVQLRPPGCCLIHGSSHLLARVGRQAVEVRMRDAAGRSRANTERGRGHTERRKRRGTHERTGQDRRNAPSAASLITTPLGLWLFLKQLLCIFISCYYILHVVG